MTTLGTCYFLNLAAAYRYYKSQESDGDEVRRKLKDGEIKIGPPPLKKDERFFLDDGQYFIQIIK